MSKINYCTMYALSETQLQTMRPEVIENFIRHKLQKRLCDALFAKFSIKKEKEFDRTMFSIDFFLATEEEFWREVIKEAKILRKHLDKQEDEQIAIDYLQKMTSSTEV